MRASVKLLLWCSLVSDMITRQRSINGGAQLLKNTIFIVTSSG